MSRVQLALNVPDIDEAVGFYSKLFATEPNKRKPGYANFAIADPPLKLVLFEKADAPERLNHLGVEVMTQNDVAAHEARLSNVGLAPVDDSGACCYAEQAKVWVDGPDGAWEIYAVLEDSDVFCSAPGATRPADDTSATTGLTAAGCCCTSSPTLRRA